MEPIEIRKHIDEIWFSEDDCYTRTAVALAEALPDQELLDLVEDYYFKKGVSPVIGKNRDGSPRYSVFIKLIRQRGLDKRLAQRQKKPIERAMTELSAEGCKRKMLLREQLKNRYVVASESDRKKILRFMLQQPTKKERQWAYARINGNWDETYRDDIATAFEEKLDNDTAIIIMNHFPAEFIHRHRKRLAAVVGLAWVYKRIGKEYSDNIDVESIPLLSEKVSVIARLGLTDYAGYLESLLYETIAAEVEYILTWGGSSCFDESFDWSAYDGHSGWNDFVNPEWHSYVKDWEDVCGFYLPRYFGLKDSLYMANNLSLYSFSGVGKIIWAMGKLGMADAIVRFSKINHGLRRGFSYHDEFCRNHVPYNVLAWLREIYAQINMGMLGWELLPEKCCRLLSREEFDNEIQSRHAEVVESTIIDSALEDNDVDDVPF